MSRFCVPSILAMILVPGLTAHAGETAADADAVAERMLNAIGGRAAWAELNNTINGSQQNRAEEPTVVHAVITMDFESPRFRIETTAKDLHLVRVINGDRSWRLRKTGQVEDVPPELLKEDLKWYAAHLYRTIHRLADADPAIGTKIGDDQRLEIHEGQKRILWLKLDAKGEPYAFGSWDDDVGGLSGPWDVVRDGIHHPRWVSSADGSRRAAVTSLTVNVPLSDQIFDRPTEK